MTKEDKVQLKNLKIKQYQNPDLMTEEDVTAIKKFEQKKYAARSQTILYTPTSVSKTPSSGVSSLGESTSSAYAVLVGDHKFHKQTFSTRKLADYDKEMESNHQHFFQAANYKAPYLIFIR